jgi:drug/metabolite transporter (DMT)-like permease
LVGIDVAGSSTALLGAVAILGAAFSYAIGPMVFKRHLADLDPRASMGASLAIAAALLTPALPLDPPSAVPTVAAGTALLLLGPRAQPRRSFPTAP